MDYDDNDFQSQNLHLAGEGSTKFPPVLRPYALPKFDFDESLQGHLRFDSLVETEVFLGIESNEDSQWIDAYSRGTSGIEFSSTAAESCSISRHNVWSEATSSESVEMLLKSVGQEEFIPRQVVIEESDACNDLACLNKKMEPNPKPNEESAFDYVTDLQPPDGVPVNVSGLKEDVGAEQSQADVSQGHEGELCIDGSSCNLEHNDTCRHVDLTVSESPFTDGKNIDANQEVRTLANDSLDGKTHDLSTSGVKANASAASDTSTCDVLDIQNVENHVVGTDNMQQGYLPPKIDKQDMESSAPNKEAHLDTQNLDGNVVRSDAHYLDKPLSVSTDQALEGGRVAEGLVTGINNIEKAVSMVQGADMQKAEICSEDMSSRNPDGDGAYADTAVNDQSALDPLPKVAIKDDTSSVGQVVEISNSSSVVCPDQQQDVDTTEKNAYGHCSAIKEKELLNIGHTSDTESLASKSGEPMFIAEDSNMTVKSEGNNGSKVGGLDSVASSSTESCIVPGSTQTCNNNKDDKQDEPKSLHQDAGINDQNSTELPSPSSQMPSNTNQSRFVDKEIASSSPSAGISGPELTTSTILVGITAVKDSATKVIIESTSLMSCKTLDVPSPSSNIVSIQATNDNTLQMSTASVVSTPVDEKQDSAKVAEEVGISTMVVSTEKETSSVNGTEKFVACDTSTKPLCEAVNNWPQLEGTNGTEKITVPQGTLVDKVIQESAKVTSVSPVPCGSTVKQGDEGAVSFDKHDKVIVPDCHEKLPTKLSGDILHGSQGSVPSASHSDSHVALHEIGDCPAYPANITSQTEKDGNQVKASTDNDVPVMEFINRNATNTMSIGSDIKGTNASKDERSSTSDVNPVADLSKTDVGHLTTKDAGKKKSFPATVAAKASTVEGSPATSVSGATETKTAGDISRRKSVSKGTSEHKPRRQYTKTPRKETSRKGSLAKETTPARQPEKGDKSSNVSMNSSPSFLLTQSSEMQQHGHNASSSTKPFAFLNTSTSGLPDLNSSASPPVLFQQPFTDQQQVQLRAQIFVYGALIQGTAPDEAYMTSAFGGADGGRSIWEKAWHACMERQHGQKSHTVNPETPQQSRSVKQNALQGKAISSPLGQASSNTTPVIVNPLTPLSSPLWSLPTPCDSLQSSALARGSVMDYPQALTSLHPYQTPPLRNLLGHGTSWVSQAPLHVPWIASPTPGPGSSSHISASPVSDPIKFTSVKGSPLPSGTKSVVPSVPSTIGGPQSIFVGTAPLLDKNVTISPTQHSSDPKPKKRKKVQISEDLAQKPLQSQSQLELTAVSSLVSTTVAVTTAVGNEPKTTVEKSATSLSTVSSSADHLKSDRMVEKRILSDESLSKVEEARGHAEEAAALSAAAVNHSLEIWNQLDRQKISGLVSDVQAKLASAAVAVAAAAAVAKAAAAAANVASNAALQAKLMADEALTSSGYDNRCQSNEPCEGLSKLGKATPASILKGANGSSSSIIVAAKEAVRRRVEAASAATKQAENMDAIVKAAELAAEAVSQAGKVVTMGDPLPLSDLLEAGPEGFCRVPQESFQQVDLSNKTTGALLNFSNAGDSFETSHTPNKAISSEDYGKQIAVNENPSPHKMYNERSKDHTRLTDGFSNSFNNNEKNIKSKGRKVSGLVDHIDVVLESHAAIQVGNGSDNLENNIKEGTLVEVFKDVKGLKAAWFTANVLSLKDGNAYVCYTALEADEGPGPLKEWVKFKGDGDQPPIIRIAPPLTGLHYEGTRKRRRAAIGDYAWSVGDRVDAWVQESWREGVVTENKKDETFAVYFPAHGETSVVKAWHLRPSLIWKDGKWTQYSRVGANDNSTHEGDTPHGKRFKLGGPAVEAKEKNPMSKSSDAVELMNPDELRLLELTENEKVFNIGKNNEDKPDTHRMVRTGLQKEGSRVIFGVPKPGKKRKFMEVSKHYVADRSNKIRDGNDSVKLANFLMPQGSGSQGWKISSKNDTREKRGANPKHKTSIKSGRIQSVLGRANPPKNNTLANPFSQSNDQTDRTEKIKDSASENQLETPSYSSIEGAVEGPILFSSLTTSIDITSSKKTSTSRASKGKLAPAGGKLGKIEEERVLIGNPEKSTSDASEPRRSNRRIQPTSRLLEGLQSSLIISKIPSVSNDKSHKNQSRNASRGNNQG